MDMKNHIQAFCAAVLYFFSLLLMQGANAEDINGSKDHPMMSRFPGSSIREYSYRNFDEYSLPIATSFSQSKNVEGRVTKIRYTSGPGSSSAQVFRSYDMALEKEGFSQLFQCKHNCGGGIKMAIGKFEGPGALGEDCRYRSGQLTRDEGDVFVSLFVCDWYDSDYVATFLHIIEAEALEEGLIKVNAEQLEKDIVQEGRAALYGLYFDADKAELKPESKSTLDEVNKLLSENPALKLLIVGHTDNVGELAYNVDLSRRRAHAVVEALVTDYGVSSNRLTAFGAGMYAPVASNASDSGREQNRRVELVQR